jgi:hypothetical protein
LSASSPATADRDDDIDLGDAVDEGELFLKRDGDGTLIRAGRLLFGTGEEPLPGGR